MSWSGPIDQRCRRERLVWVFQFAKFRVDGNGGVEQIPEGLLEHLGIKHVEIGGETEHDGLRAGVQ